MFTHGKKTLIKHHLPLLSVAMCCTNYWDKCTLNKGKNGMRMPWPTAEEAQSIYSPARLGLIIMRLSRVALVDPLPTAVLGVLHHQHAVGRGLAQREYQIIGSGVGKAAPALWSAVACQLRPTNH